MIIKGNNGGDRSGCPYAWKEEGSSGGYHILGGL